jgi:hypothetical protein
LVNLLPPNLDQIAMTFTDFVYAMQTFFEATFEILPILGNSPNYLFILIGIAGFFYWLNLQVKYNRAANRGEGRK